MDLEANLAQAPRLLIQICSRRTLLKEVALERTALVPLLLLLYYSQAQS